MSDVIQKYFCNVIFEKKNEVDVLPRWAFCPTLPYKCENSTLTITRFATNIIRILSISLIPIPLRPMVLTMYYNAVNCEFT